MRLELPLGGYVVGLGSDIVDVDRIRRVWEKQADRFLQRVFTQEELDYCLSMKHPHKHLAARFAAKEAVSKAFTTGIGARLRWKSVSIYKGEREEPRVRLDELGQELLREVGATSVFVTLSHTETLAQAVALVLRDEKLL